VCLSENPKNFRNRTSGLIHLESGQSILIDATPDLRHQALQHKVKKVDAVLYTHAHADHICGTDDLRVFNFISNSAIDCYGAASTLTGLRTLFPHIVNPDPAYQGGFIAKLAFQEISNHGDFSVFGSTVKAFPLPHGNVTVTGFRIGNLGYATDCKGLSNRAAEVLQGVDVLFLDGLRWEQHRTHNTIDEAIEIAREVGARQTYLIHTTHTIEYDEVSAQLPPGIALGYDGLRVQFTS
jgi:phosphoribosyl 1,2-cyclic phosphate phosphodiesterase